MACEDDPWSGGPVYVGKMVGYPAILLCPTHKVVLSAHHHKVDLTIVKTKPVGGNEEIVL